MLNRVARDLLKDDPVDRDPFGHIDRLTDMPGNRLTLTIGVGSQVDCVNITHRLAQFTHHLLFGDLIDRLEVMFYIDREIALRQITYMPHARGYPVTTAQIFLNGLRLCRRLDDNELITHREP